MRKNLLVTLILVFSSITLLRAHIELVGEFLVETDGNKILITATLEKRHLALALKKEGKCEPQDMMRVCGNQYIRKNLRIKINGNKVNTRFTNMQLTAESGIYQYEINLAENELTLDDIEVIAVHSDYMMKHNDHGLVRFAFQLDEDVRTFHINYERRDFRVHYDKQ